MEKLKVTGLPAGSTAKRLGIVRLIIRSLLYLLATTTNEVVVVRKRESMQQQVTFGLRPNQSDVVELKRFRM